MQWVLDKKDFLKGHAISSEIGGLFMNSSGIDPYNSDLVGTSADLNSVGALRPGYGLTDFGGADVWSLISQMIVAANPSDNTFFLFGVDDSARAYRVNITSDAAPDTLATSTGFDRGMAVYNNGTDTRIYVAGATAIADISTPFGTMVWTNPTSGSPPTLTSSRPHPMFVKNGVLWVGDDNDIYALDRSAIWRSGSQLVIPPIYSINSLSEYDRFLAVGAMEFYASSGIARFVNESKVFLWDTVSFSWNFEYTLTGTLVQLLNRNGKFYALTALDGGFILYQFNGNEFVELTSKSDAGYAIATLFGKTIFDMDRGRFYWPMADTDLTNRFNLSDQTSALDIWAYGSFYSKLPKVINKPYKILETTSVVDATNIGALKVGRQNKVYVSFFNGLTGGYKLGVFKTGSESDASWHTISLSSYFNERGGKKRLNFIQYEFDPLASGSTMAAYAFFDYERDLTVSARLNGADDAGDLNAVSFALDGAATVKRFRTFRTSGTNTEGLFRDIRLGGAHLGGDVRIRKIVIDWNYVTDAGDY